MNDYTKWHQSQPDIGLDEAIERIEGKMKAILIMDMPEDCNRCRLPDYISECEEYYCAPADRCLLTHVDDIPRGFKPDWCPLIPAIGYIEAKGNMVSWEDDSDVD